MKKCQFRDRATPCKRPGVCKIMIDGEFIGRTCVKHAVVLLERADKNMKAIRITKKKAKAK